MPKRVVIIGGGIGGLATAALLAKAGYNVALYEKNAVLGGRASQRRHAGFTFDTGPSWYLMPEVFRHFYTLMGTTVDAELTLTKLRPAYKVFFETVPPITITGNQKEDERTFEQIEPGAGAALRRYIDRGEVIYRLSLTHFLYTNFTRSADFLQTAVLRRGLSMLKLALQPIDRYVSNYVRDRRLKQILEYPMVFLGSSPFEAPAIYSLMSALDFREGVYYPQGGLYTIITSIAKLARSAGASLYTAANVQTINHRNGRATGITLTSGKQVTADIVISNADIHHTEINLLDASARSYPEAYWQRRQAGPSALLMYLGIRGHLPQFEHHNLFFVDDWHANFSAIFGNATIPTPASIYVSKPSQTDKSVAPSGHENVFILVPLPSGVTVNTKTAKQLSEQYLEQLEVMSGISDLRDRIVTKTLFGPNDFQTQFYAWQSSALGASHRLRQSAMFRTPNRSRKLTNLYYVGANTVPGIGLPMCLIGAELIYKRLIGDRRGGAVQHLRSDAGKS